MASGNSVGTAYLTLVPKLDSNMAELDKGMAEVGKKGGTSFIGGFKKLAGSAVVVSAAMAVVDVFAQSFEASARNEQLVGGIETLFKESADSMKQYAKEAYKTAGISANQFMEQSTSFAASLASSLGGDTAAAAEYANQAIIDMSDNANKMGTSIESIQNAYQGFAKQNYTMLDNLKLGYGGTKTEMERLLRDAEKIKAANGEMVSYSIENFADMVEAIHVVQEDMGITGTTAAEAGSTVEGSIGQMKAAWENFVVAIGTGDDIEKSAQNLVESFIGAFKNIIPLAVQIIKGMALGVISGFGSLLNEGISFINGMVSDFAIAGTNLIDGLIDGIVGAAGAVVDCIKRICSNALDAVKSFFGIHSPSRVMRQMGGYIGEGLALGIEDSEDVVEDAMDGLNDMTYMGAASIGSGGFSGGSITIHNLTVSAADAQSAQAFATMLRRAAMQYA